MECHPTQLITTLLMLDSRVLKNQNLQGCQIFLTPKAWRHILGKNCEKLPLFRALRKK